MQIVENFEMQKKGSIHERKKRERNSKEPEVETNENSLRDGKVQSGTSLFL